MPTPDGEELTIWDSKTSEFSSGLEYQEILRYSLFAVRVACTHEHPA